MACSYQRRNAFCLLKRSEMGVRTFVRIEKVIWDQFPACTVEIIQSDKAKRFSCEMPRGDNYLLDQDCFAVFIFSSKSFKNNLRKMSSFNFQLSGNNYSFFFLSKRCCTLWLCFTFAKGDSKLRARPGHETNSN